MELPQWEDTRGTPRIHGWLPLGTTPNHPEYSAAHACITGADSTAFQDGVHTYNFEDPRDLLDVFGARMYAGFHYFHSMKDGGEL